MTVVIGFAHRGARKEHRDNTLPGFSRALALGASGLESDAWVTADGVAVLDHDGVFRHRLGRRRIAGSLRCELPAHIPSLGELYALDGARTVEVSIDVKDPAAAAAILDAAGPSRTRLWLCSGDLATLAGWRRADAEVRLVHSSGLRRLPLPTGGHPRRLAAAGIDALNLRAGEWTAELVGACHREGVRAFGWDAQDVGTMRRLVGMGIDGMYCDDVAAMVAVVGPNTGDLADQLRAAPGSEQLDTGDRPHPEHGATDDQITGDGPDVPRVG